MKSRYFEIETIQAHSNLVTLDVALLMEYRGAGDTMAKTHVYTSLAIMRDTADPQKFHVKTLQLRTTAERIDFDPILRFTAEPHKMAIDDNRKYCKVKLEVWDHPGVFEFVSIHGSSDVKTVLNVRPLQEAKKP